MPNLYPGLGSKVWVGEEVDPVGSPFALHSPVVRYVLCLCPLPLASPPGLPLSPPQKQGSPCTWLRPPGALPPLLRVLSTAPLTQLGRSCRPSMGVSPQIPQGIQAPGASMLLQNGARGTVV